METSPIEYGPFPEETMLSAGLDYYKLTMSQFIHEYEPDTEATFTFKNRGKQRLLDYVDPTRLEARLDFIRSRGFSTEELDYFRTLRSAEGERMFADDYLDFIAKNSLPPVEVEVENDDLAISATGDWTTTTFWETVVMSEVNEQYFEGYMAANGINPFEIYAEGDRILSEKIAYLHQHPEVMFAEFGTRRRFSMRWHRHVLNRLKNECPNNLIGTSNVAFAGTMGLKPVGTFAHELPMGYAGLADARGESIRGSHGKLLDDWYEFYDDELAVALSDTFGSDFFFEDFTPERAARYKGTRHDSGDPFVYGEKAITHYNQLDIDPATKMVLFSDNLTFEKAADLTAEFGNQITTPNGIGTFITNDFGVKALNVVMKETHVHDRVIGKGADTVKLSDDPGKHTGPAAKIEQYQQEFQPLLVAV